MKNGKIQKDRNILFLCLFLVYFIGCRPVNLENQKRDVSVLYSEDSTIVLAVGLKDNFGKQGEWFFFDESGSIKTISNYRNDTLNGLVTEFSCCKKFMQYIVDGGNYVEKITYYSPDGHVSGVTYLDSLKSGYEIKLHNSKIFQIDLLENGGNVKSIFSDPKVDASNIYFDSSGCCCN